MVLSPRRVVDIECEIGENPLWHPDDKRLYWCDIVHGRVHWYDPDTQADGIVHESDEPIGGFTIQSDGTLLLFQDHGVVRRLDPTDGRIDVVVEPNPERFQVRFNDVIADPVGRVFAGTMPALEDGVPGRLYRLDRDGTLTTVVDEAILPNGLGFSGDRSSFYFTDSAMGKPDVSGKIYRYEYDEESGALANPEVFVDSTGIPGFPDGMTVDEDDHVWSAYFGGSRVERYSPEGECVEHIDFDPKKVLCVTFGGEDYGTVYATTACQEGREIEGDGAGSVFSFEPDVGGRPEFRSRIEV